MKRCTQTHTVASFGEIPAGSLWADDSPYAIEADCFEPVDDTPAPAKVRKPVRKFAQPAPTTEGEAV